MKTTVEIADPLFAAAKQLASREGRSFRAVVEEALRRFLDDKKPQPEPFRLKKVTFGGDGLQPEFADASWEAIRDEIYRGHGT